MVISLSDGRADLRQPSVTTGAVVLFSNREPVTVINMAPTGAVINMDMTQITNTVLAYPTSGPSHSRTMSSATGPNAACKCAVVHN